MVVQAYILIQTEVGKAADVATAIAQIPGVTLAEDVTGPYDVIVRAEARERRRAGQAGRGQGAGSAGHHPHPHLPGRPPLAGRAVHGHRAEAPRAAGDPPLVLVFVAGVVVLGAASVLLFRERPVAVVVPHPVGDAARGLREARRRAPRHGRRRRAIATSPRSRT